MNHSAELSLAWFASLTIYVFVSAFRFSRRRLSSDCSLALLDAGLIGYAIQYISVGLPGVLGTLSALTITATAILISTVLLFASISSPKTVMPSRLRIFPIAVSAFVIGFVLCYAHHQRFLTVISNDAMTYHFPAAVQWLQRGKIETFQVWFFNPANTYSPLAGSTFISWILAPMGTDVLAKYVEVPPLLLVGLALFQICRSMKLSTNVSALLAASAVLCRPMLTQSMMSKDDLFVAFFFLAAVAALSSDRITASVAPVRIGLAIGLMLAIKYTALLSLPVLLLAADAPLRAGWRWKKSVLCVGIALLIVGPWYLRNLIVAHNPIFPIDVSLFGNRLFPGLFSTSRSLELRSIAGIYHVLCGGLYGLPVLLSGVVFAVWLCSWKFLEQEPIVRVCVIGPVVGSLLFLSTAPFPELRFLFPTVLLMFAGAGLVLNRLPTFVSLAIFLAAIGTSYSATYWQLIAIFSVGGGLLALVCIAFVAYVKTNRITIAAAIIPIVLIPIIYIYWAAYVDQYRAAEAAAISAWSGVYPIESQLWAFVENSIPSDAIIAYTNVYMVYPLQGSLLKRQVIYAPTRARVHRQTDLPWLGKNVPGETIVPAATLATVADADKAVWLENLASTHAQYLLIGYGGMIPSPAEREFVRDDSQFKKLFENSAGAVYQIMSAEK